VILGSGQPDNGQADSGQRGLVILGSGQADSGQRGLVILGSGQGRQWAEGFSDFRQWAGQTVGRGI